MKQNLLLLFALLLSCQTPKAPVGAPKEDPRVLWLKQNATVIKGVDLGMELTDLEPLRAMVGEARVVLLGERSHGDADALSMKIRMIKFLHEEMDFQVPAVEAGLYDCLRADMLLAQGEDPSTATRACLSNRTSRNEPLRTYLTERATSKIPLHLAGFDCQITDKEVKERTALAIADFLARSNLPEDKQLTQAISRLRNYSQRRTDLEHQEDQEALNNLIKKVSALPSSKEQSFFLQLARSLSTQEQSNWDYQQKGELDIAQINLRDAQMAENLLWIQTQYPEEKIIVTTATYHTMRHPEELVATPEATKDQSMGAMIDGFVPMGQHLTNKLGTQVVSLAIITAGGYSDCCKRETEQGITSAPPNSLEALLGAAGFSYALLDLRRAPWLNEKILGRPQGHEFYQMRWPRVVDGVVFIQKMSADKK